MLETLDHTISIGSTPTFLYFDLFYFLIVSKVSSYACSELYLKATRDTYNIWKWLSKGNIM